MNQLVREARALCEGATEGPWRAGRADMGTFVDGYESKWIYAGEPNKLKYLAVSSGYEIKDWDEVMANAHLIARSRTLIPEMADEIERLEATLEKTMRDLDQLKAANDQHLSDFEAGRLVRLPNELIAPYELNSRYWVCGWDAEDCTMIIQDRVLKAKVKAGLALLAAMKEDAHE